MTTQAYPIIIICLVSGGRPSDLNRFCLDHHSRLQCECQCVCVCKQMPGNQSFDRQIPYLRGYDQVPPCQVVNYIVCMCMYVCVCVGVQVGVRVHV